MKIFSNSWSRKLNKGIIKKIENIIEENVCRKIGKNDQLDGHINYSDKLLLRFKSYHQRM